MTVILSNHLDRLLDFLAKKIEISLGAETWILLPGSINKQWLSLELVKRMPQEAICGLRLLGWKEALRKLYFPGPSFFEAGCSFATADWFGKEQNGLIWRLSHQAQEMGIYAIEEQKEWQKALFQSLSRWQTADRMIKRMPAQIHCFCVEELSESGWDFLFRARASFYLFSPCRMFWEDLCTDRQREFVVSKISSKEAQAAMETALQDTHPLLANWGRVARGALKKVEQLESIEAHEEREGDSLLHVIQRDLLNLRTLGDGPASIPLDSSLQIVAAGASKLNEVTILKEEILKLVLEEKVSYSEILVLAPDIQDYEPLIRYVFGEEIPIRIGPLPAQSPLCRGALLFFELAKGEWDADDLLEFFEQEAFQKKQSLSRDDLSWFRIWMKEAFLRGGWENVLDGMQRMQNGLIYLLPEDQGPHRISTIDWGEAERLELFLSLIQLLKKQIDAVQESRTLKLWAVQLREISKELFEADDEGHWNAFLETLLSTSFSFPEEKFSFSFIHSAFQEHCEAEKEVSGALLVDAIDFLSLQPGAVRPAHALFLLGADGEQLPRSEELSSSDWKLKKPDRADLDRSLLLQILFAAKERVFVSYCHISGEDGQPVDLAHPIQELVDLLGRFYGIKELPKKRLLRQREGSVAKKPWPRETIDPRSRWQLFDLGLLMRDPWGYFLQKTLGVYLKPEQLFAELSFKECFLSFSMERRLMEKFDEDQLPPGPFGVLAEEKIKDKIADWKRRFDSWGGTISFTSENPLVLDSGIEIVGEVNYAEPGSLFVETDLSFSSLLRCWPSYLAVSALSSSPATIYSLKNGKSKTFEGLDAKKELSLLIRYALRAQESFSPLFPSWAEPLLKNENCEELPELESYQWVLDRFEVPSFEQLREEWTPLLREVFHALL